MDIGLCSVVLHRGEGGNTGHMVVLGCIGHMVVLVGTGSHNCDKTDIGHEVPLGSIHSTIGHMVPLESIHSAIGHMVYISIVNISIMT